MGLNMDGLRKRKARGGFGWRPNAGPNKVRILPPSREYYDSGDDGIDYIATDFSVHFIKRDGQDTVVTRCARDEAGESCPCCIVYSKYREWPQDPGLEKHAKELRRVNRRAFNILDLNDVTKGIQVYVCGIKVHDQILQFVMNPQWGEMLSVTHGRDWDLTMTPQGQTASGWPEYNVVPNPNPTDVSSFLPEEWMDQLEGPSVQAPDVMDGGKLEEIMQGMGFEVGKA